MQSIVLTITRNPDGSIAVSGPIGDKVVAYGLLEAARDAIQEYNAKQAASPIVRAAAMPGLHVMPSAANGGG